jgi:hypothetical protein
MRKTSLGVSGKIRTENLQMDEPTSTVVKCSHYFVWPVPLVTKCVPPLVWADAGSAAVHTIRYPTGSDKRYESDKITGVYKSGFS